MQHLLTQIHKSLIKKKKTLAVAESCTGGLSSFLLTELAGSSHYFLLGVVAYSNKTKERILRIPEKIILKKGAVSAEVAALMAENARRIASSDLGIGITGIAGPAGATIDKPVGTVFISLSSKDKKICQRFQFQGGRAQIRKKAALKSLQLLKKML